MLRPKSFDELAWQLRNPMWIKFVSPDDWYLLVRGLCLKAR